MSESLTLYKLIILYMLNRVNFPLTNAQISAFILDKEYTTYFTLQQAISEMADSNLVRIEAVRNSTHYYITEEGKNTLEYFGNKISAAIKDDILAYMKEHNYELRNEVSVLADYYKTTNHDYAVQCQVKEKGAALVDLTLTVPLKEQAEIICKNWHLQNQEIYAYLMAELLKENTP